MHLHQTATAPVWRRLNRNKSKPATVFSVTISVTVAITLVVLLLLQLLSKRGTPYFMTMYIASYIHVIMHACCTVHSICFLF